eukprot:TRINITY_DN1537_c0_g1_i1.p1 TRINITY_DN1537_c0_g1~~TRINITY_DN1537_c0_g1_i1.p1  ORF type:complete len:317 (-),score=109.54 TRINITY_DN1537_c0_g1_i1:10-960(-)
MCIRDRKKKKIDKQENLRTMQNPMADIKIYGFSKEGYGAKKKECQDSFCLMEKFQDDCSYFAVYDGHGSSGKEASQAASDYISNYLQKKGKKFYNFTNDKNRIDFLKEAFRSAENQLKSSGIDYSTSGTCAIGIFIYKHLCLCCNLGDSRAVLFRQTNKEKQAIELSYDHKPTRPDEKERILKCGGRIEKLVHDGQPIGPYRVWADEEGPGIAMTRTLGDLQAKKIGIKSDPEIQTLKLEKTDHFIIIGSDGIWDVMSSAEVCGFVSQQQNQEKAAQALAEECRQRWEENNRQKNCLLYTSPSPRDKRQSRMPSSA